MSDITPVHVSFFHMSEVMPFQTFGPFEWADMEGLDIRALPMPTEDEPHPEVVYIASYMIPGTDWTPDDAPGEGWVATAGDARFTYIDVSIGTDPDKFRYESPELTDDQIARLNDNSQLVRESVGEELADPSKKTSAATVAIDYIQQRIDQLKERRAEYIQWMVTYDPMHTPPSSVADWVKTIEQLDHTIDEMARTRSLLG